MPAVEQYLSDADLVHVGGLLESATMAVDLAETEQVAEVNAPISEALAQEPVPRPA